MWTIDPIRKVTWCAANPVMWLWSTNDVFSPSFSLLASSSSFSTLYVAGPMDFNACGPGPAYHLQHMSVTCRHSLADQINQSNTFQQFCRALGVGDELMKRASRSGNPTAYLLQEYQERPEATFDRLEQALSQMGRRDLFDHVWQLQQSSVH